MGGVERQVNSGDVVLDSNKVEGRVIFVRRLAVDPHEIAQVDFGTEGVKWVRTSRLAVYE